MKKLLAFAIMGLISVPAMAADLGANGGGYKDDLSGVVGPCSGVTWTGLRVGGLIGVGATGIGSGTGTETYLNEAGKPVTSDGVVSGSYQLSTVGQFEIGGDYQFKNSPLVIGAFANVGYGSGTSQFTYSGDVRLGVAWGNALIYGFGGYEKGHLVHTLSDISTGATLASVKADPSGLVYGFGVDVALGHGWYGGVRAERADYGTFSASGSANNVDYIANVSGTDDRLLFTLGYKFGG